MDFPELHERDIVSIIINCGDNTATIRNNNSMKISDTSTVSMECVLDNPNIILGIIMAAFTSGILLASGICCCLQHCSQPCYFRGNTWLNKSPRQVNQKPMRTNRSERNIVETRSESPQLREIGERV